MASKRLNSKHFPHLLYHRKSKKTSRHASNVQLQRRKWPHSHHLRLAVCHLWQGGELKMLEQKGKDQFKFLQSKPVADAHVRSTNERLVGVKGNGWLVQESLWLECFRVFPVGRVSEMWTSHQANLLTRMLCTWKIPRSQFKQRWPEGQWLQQQTKQQQKKILHKCSKKISDYGYTRKKDSY